MADLFAREQIIMADHAVNSIIESNGGENMRPIFEMFLRAALTVDDKLRARDTWRARVNFNSANDGEITR